MLTPCQCDRIRHPLHIPSPHHPTTTLPTPPLTGSRSTGAAWAHGIAHGREGPPRSPLPAPAAAPPPSPSPLSPKPSPHADARGCGRTGTAVPAGGATARCGRGARGPAGRFLHSPAGIDPRPGGTGARTSGTGRPGAGGCGGEGPRAGGCLGAVLGTLLQTVCSQRRWYQPAKQMPVANAVVDDYACPFCNQQPALTSPALRGSNSPPCWP